MNTLIYDQTKWLFISIMDILTIIAELFADEHIYEQEYNSTDYGQCMQALFGLPASLITNKHKKWRRKLQNCLTLKVLVMAIDALGHFETG